MDMQLILFDDARWHHLLPLTYTRPASHLRVGILTIKEKWEEYLNQPAFDLAQDYLSKKFPLPSDNGKPCLLINGGIFPNEKLVEAIGKLNQNQALVKDGKLISVILPYNKVTPDKVAVEHFNDSVEFHDELTEIFYPWDIFSQNTTALSADWERLTQGRKSQPISPSNHVVNAEQVFVEEGAKIECAVLNAQAGPIYIGRNAEVMEGAVIRGPFALGEHSEVKIGAKIYGPTTIGPHCKVGGEVNNSVIQGYTNKAHDGFLGNSVIGAWCNLGADTNTSNLKNNYANVRLWSYVSERFADTGLLFCGLIMGDHSKCGINTMFNTGTVVGVACNIFGDGFPRNFIPSYSWGGAHGFSTNQVRKVLETESIVMARRGLELDEEYKSILEHLFEISAKQRR